MKDQPITFAIAMPILWGLERGFSISDVARGLMLRERTVVVAVQKFGPRWLALQIGQLWRGSDTVDRGRAEKDWAYANWARARLAASDILDDMGEM